MLDSIDLQMPIIYNMSVNTHRIGKIFFNSVFRLNKLYISVVTIFDINKTVH